MTHRVRVCPVPGCPSLVEGGGRCPQHARPSFTARYPGWSAKRRAAAKRVATGTVDCWRCGLRIAADEPWDLGHDDYDRAVVRGPEHRSCNRSAAGRASQEALR